MNLDKNTSKINKKTLKEAALHYVKNGIPVIPLYGVVGGVCECKSGVNCSNPGKHPKIKYKGTHGIDDPIEVNKFWQRQPHSNIGILPGDLGIIVVDIDVKHGSLGERTLERWEKIIGEDISTYTETTGSGGGKHLFYKVPKGFKIGNSRQKDGKTISRKVGGLGPGIDIITGDNAPVVMAPSNHHSGGQYLYESGDLSKIKPLPERWAVWGSLKTDIPDHISDRRNESILSFGGKYRLKNDSVDEIPKIIEELDLICCDNPLIYETSGPAEIEKLIREISKYENGAEQHYRPTGVYKPTDDMAETLARELAQKFDWFWSGQDDEPLWLYQSELGIWTDCGKNFLNRYVAKARSSLIPGKGGKKIPIRGLSADVYHLLKTILQPFKKDFPSMEKHLIPFENGLLNIETKEFRAYKKEDFATYKIPTKYKENKDCPWIKELLNDWVDKEQIPLLFELIGLCLMRDYPVQKAFFLMGEGGNGKGRFLDIINGILGKNLVSAMGPQHLGERFASYGLYEKHANVCGDISPRIMEDTSVFKQLTGGDEVHVEIKGSSNFKTFISFATVVYSANKMPSSFDSTHGFLRRLCFIDFNKKIPESKKDGKLSQKIRNNIKELEGVVSIAIEHLYELEKRNWKLTGQKSVEEITKENEKRAHPFAVFLEECCDLESDESSSLQDISLAYDEFAEAYHLEKLSNRRVSDKLRRRRYRSKTKNGLIHFEGVHINSFKLKIALNPGEIPLPAIEENEFNEEIIAPNQIDTFVEFLEDSKDSEFNIKDIDNLIIVELKKLGYIVVDDKISAKWKRTK